MRLAFAFAFAVTSCAPAPATPSVTIEARTPAPQAEVRRAPELDGAELARRFGCTTCHGLDQRLVGPAWRGVYGSNVTLGDGRMVLADEAYIIRSIFEPSVEVVEGFPPMMPSFRGTFDDAAAHAIAQYIRSLR